MGHPGLRWAGIAAALAALAALAGCSAPVGQPSGAEPPAAESSGIAPACIDPCGITYEVRLPSTVTNGTYRPTAQIRDLVLDAVRTALAARSDIDVDEGSDPTTRANALSLGLAVPSLAYANGLLTAKVRITVFRYTTGALLGSIEKTVSARTSSPSQGTEDLVIRTAATKATEAFIVNLPSY